MGTDGGRMTCAGDVASANGSKPKVDHQEFVPGTAGTTRSARTRLRLHGGIPTG